MSDYAKEHDILKLCDDFEGVKIHYCPERLVRKLRERGEAQAAEFVENLEAYSFLRHHCNLGYRRHDCANPYAINRTDFYLTISDQLASKISRKLRLGKISIRYEVLRIWKVSKNDLQEKRDSFEDIIEELQQFDLEKLFNSPKNQERLRRQPEDARYPFSSLMIHSELTARWFEFFENNNDYFDTPEVIADLKDFWTKQYDIFGRVNVKNGKQRKPIFFLRLRIVPNEKIARLADTRIIAEVQSMMAKIIEAVAPEFQILYELYNEFVFVGRPEIEDDVNDIDEQQVKKALETRLRELYGFTTNYFFEVNLAKAYLANYGRKNRWHALGLLRGFDRMFKEPHLTIYPKLDSKIDPEIDWDKDDESIVDAKEHKLCELCQLKPAEQRFVKYERDFATGQKQEGQAVEYLCSGCYSLRLQLDREEYERRGIGYHFAHWEYEREKGEEVKPCFIYLSLDLEQMNALMKHSYKNELEIKGEIGEENLGFSIVHEFLEDYKLFVETFINETLRLFDLQKDSRNLVVILPNFICVKISEYHEIDRVLKKFVEIYSSKHFFPRWKTSATPIHLSVSSSDIKFPFFQHWQFLNDKKEHPLNVRISRKIDLQMGFQQYEQLAKMTEYPETKISHILHILDEVERKTESGFLVQTLIAEREDNLKEIFDPIPKAKDILAYYNLMRGKVIEKHGQAYVF